MHLRLQQRAFRREVQIAFGVPSFNTYEVVDMGTWACGGMAYQGAVEARWHTSGLLDSSKSRPHDKANQVINYLLVGDIDRPFTTFEHWFGLKRHRVSTLA